MVYENGTILEDSLYEIPVNAVQHVNLAENEHEFPGSTYADNNPHEYAIVGPNEEMVNVNVYVHVCVCVHVCVSVCVRVHVCVCVCM